ncbi:uracil permease [Pseudozyma hubeiensis SY62]|uniref:Uracil permease n=1 Tax=Pseudozyma hubeiensis (strain SY62) TaxID=1305764 RepID=R9NYL0_PSEHS|nr:uracil permease [Pseudozyma hubeiensis SY62]GAC93863.1 uracil permease [Pseudozyma hubeiensis SY62]
MELRRSGKCCLLRILHKERVNIASSHQTTERVPRSESAWTLCTRRKALLSSVTLDFSAEYPSGHHLKSDFNVSWTLSSPFITLRPNAVDLPIPLPSRSSGFGSIPLATSHQQPFPHPLRSSQPHDHYQYSSLRSLIAAALLNHRLRIISDHLTSIASRHALTLSTSAVPRLDTQRFKSVHRALRLAPVIDGHTHTFTHMSNSVRRYRASALR